MGHGNTDAVCGLEEKIPRSLPTALDAVKSSFARSPCCVDYFRSKLALPRPVPMVTAAHFSTSAMRGTSERP